MVEEVPVVSAAPAKSPKKKVVKPKKKAGPSVSDLIVEAVSASKERKGVSLAALKKNLAAGGYDVEKNNSRVKAAVKSLVVKGSLVQTKGAGASGSFKAAKSAEKPKKPVAVKTKKPAAKKPVAAKATPKKAKKPAAKKAVVAKATPKKAKKPAAAAKKPAAKKAVKSPKKKVVKKAATPKKAAKKVVKAKVAKPKRAPAKKAVKK
ncbi:histone H1-like [Genypterus blacodes]|uniref:histone H1-like n=1 Tax=Genypterus blacodes TaxID=154954 RepID=UPI003F75ECD0